MNLKFSFTGETKLWLGITLKRIKRNSDGAVGGWIEKESNIDLSGNAWVSGNAQVSGNARVSGDAQVSGNAWVYGNAQVSGNAWVSGDAQVSGNAWVSGDAQVSGNAWVYGDAQVSGNAWVSGDAQVSGNARVSGNAQVSGNAWVSGDAQVSGNARVYAQLNEGFSVAAQMIVHASIHVAAVCGIGKIAIGCEIHTIAEWRKSYKAIGKKNGYDAAAIREYKAVIEFLAATPKKNWPTKSAPKGYPTEAA